MLPGAVTRTRPDSVAASGAVPVDREAAAEHYFAREIAKSLLRLLVCGLEFESITNGCPDVRQRLFGLFQCEVTRHLLWRR